MQFREIGNERDLTRLKALPWSFDTRVRVSKTSKFAKFETLIILKYINMSKGDWSFMSILFNNISLNQKFYISLPNFFFYLSLFCHLGKIRLYDNSETDSKWLARTSVIPLTIFASVPFTRLISVSPSYRRRPRK